MIYVNSVSVTPDNLTLLVNTWYYDATVEVCPGNANCGSVIWTSDNTDVVTVNPTTGYIYAKALGSAKVYATACDDSGKSDFINVTVTDTLPVSSVTLNRTSASVEIGKSITLSASVAPANASNKNLIWTSSAPNIATVQNGVVTAIAEGTAVITATAADGSGKFATCNVTVTPEVLVTDITVYPNPETYTMVVGTSKYMRAVVCPSNASNKGVIWSSSNNDVATVNPESGHVYAQAEGTVIIYATACDGSGVQGSCQLTVTPFVHVTGIDLCSPKETLLKNSVITEDVTLNVAVYPGNATNKNYTLTSSDTKIATVDSETRRVTSRGIGTVTITATTADGNHTDSVTLRVVIDNVTIVKDSISGSKAELNNVVFQSSNKIWKCVNYNLIHQNDNSSEVVDVDLCKERFEYNFCNNKVYPTKDDLITYFDEELKLLYAIDPYGVAMYVHTYANFLGSLNDCLSYKDHIFSLLFNRPPKYYKRYDTEAGYRWVITSDKSNLSEVISESESLFGAHPVWDEYSVSAFIKFVLKNILNIDIISDLEDIFSIINAVLTLSTNENAAKNTICSYIAQTSMQLTCDAFDLGWACSFVSTAKDAMDILNLAADCPEFYNPVIDYCTNDIPYNVYIELSSETVDIKDISNALSNQN